MSDTTNLETSVNVLLPALSLDHNFKKPKQAGKWEGIDSDDLIGISKGLETKPAKLQINSIPDIWARLLLFESALFDSAHKLHDIVLGEWRGLMALIALKELKNIQHLLAVPFSLSDEIKENNRLWHNSLQKLIPDTQIFNNTTWNNIYVFLVDGKPVGVTTPTTLVATATAYSSLTLSRSQIGWYDGKILSDPLKTELSVFERKTLSGWLHILFEHLKVEAPLDTKRIEKLLTLITDYRDALSSDASTVALSINGYGISGVTAGVFTFLNNPIATPIQGESSTRLIGSRSKPNALPIYLVDRDIADQWKVQPSQVSVYGADTLASIPYEGLSPHIHNKLNNKDVSDAEIWMPQALFNDNLYYVYSEKAFPGTVRETWHQNQIPKIDKEDISIILPLTQKLLEHFTSTDLLEKLVFVQDSNSEEITIILTVNLSGLDGQEKPYRITKKYSRDKMIEFSQVPILEIFPNFSSENWKAYYTAYSADNLSATFFVSPYSTDSDEIDVQNRPNAKRCIWKTATFPEAFVCSYRDRGETESKDIGLLLLEKPQTIEAPHRKFTVGVDFGASGSMIYYAEGNNRKPLDFKQNRKISITKKSDSQRADVLKFFLPEADVHPAFLTLYHDFNNQGKEHQSFLNGHIYYFSGINDVADNNVYSNLKWSEDSKMNFFVRSFLAQICLQASAELVALGADSIDWRFSYPTAFTPDQTSNLKAIWQRIINTASSLTGLPANAPRELSESIAAAECFRNGGAFLDEHQVSTESGVVFIDIGGSTSDISIYQNNQLLTQFSIRFAGRDLFLQYLRKNPKVLADVGINNQNIDNRTDLEKFWAQIDSVLKQEGDKVFADLPLNSGLETVKALKKYLAVGLSGLFYYIGLAVNQLIEKEQSYSGLTPHFYIAGNGSKMFQWLTNDTAINEHPIKKLFERVFHASLSEINLEGVFDMKITEKPKHESAYGLVCQSTLPTTIEAKPVIAGESFLSDNKSLDWKTSLTEEVLETTFDKPKELEQLPKFIDAFNNFVKKDKSITPIKYDNTVQDSVIRSLKTMLSKSDRDEQKIVFILALKSLLDTLD